MLIRTTTAEDGPKLRKLRLEALTNHPLDFCSSPEDAMKLDWNEQAAAGHGDGLVATFVAEEDGELLGMTRVELSGRLKLPHSGWIQSVYVRPDFRRRGVAGLLVNAALTWALAKGRSIIRLGVIAKNAGAIACYLKCGFSIYGVEPATIMVDGVEYDELMMARRLKVDR